MGEDEIEARSGRVHVPFGWRAESAFAPPVRVPAHLSHATSWAWGQGREGGIQDVSKPTNETTETSLNLSVGVRGWQGQQPPHVEMVLWRSFQKKLDKRLACTQTPHTHSPSIPLMYQCCTWYCESQTWGDLCVHPSFGNASFSGVL